MEAEEIVSKLKTYLIEKLSLDLASSYAIAKKLKDELWDDWESGGEEEAEEEDLTYLFDDAGEEEAEESQKPSKPPKPPTPPPVQKPIMKRPQIIRTKKPQNEIDEGNF